MDTKRPRPTPSVPTARPTPSVTAAAAATKPPTPRPPAPPPPPAPRPEPTPRWDLTDEGIARDSEVQFFIGSGPGGQNRNKRETGVRMTHGPTGLVVESERHRSQGQNRSECVRKIRERLLARLVVQKPRKATKPTRGSQRRRLEGKQHVARKKADRRGGDEG